MLKRTATENVITGKMQVILGKPYLKLFEIIKEIKFNLNFSISKKTQFDFSQPYPFILVNVGSGVSVLGEFIKNCFNIF